MERQVLQVPMKPPELPKLLRTSAYARVSSGKEEMLNSLAAQISYYSDYIQRNKNWSFAGVYFDEAKTGTKDTRDGFQRLIMDCRAGKIDMIITKSVSRFARNTLTLLEVVRELKSLGVCVYFEEQRINSLKAEGELMLSVLAAHAQAESLAVSKNMKWYFQSRFKKGLSVGVSMMGLKAHQGTFLIDPAEGEIIKLIFSLNGQGYGRNAIMRKLNAWGIPSKEGGRWHESTVGFILANEKYKGELLLQKTFVENHLTKKKRINTGEMTQYRIKGNHPALVEPAIFDDLQVQRQKRYEKYKPKVGVAKCYPFSNMIVCEHCGKNFNHKFKNGREMWICKTYMGDGKAKCSSSGIHDSVLRQLVADVLHIPQFDEAIFKKETLEIRATGPRELRFIMKNGQAITREWDFPSRRDSWTDDMREQARQHALKGVK